MTRPVMVSLVLLLAGPDLARAQTVPTIRSWPDAVDAARGARPGAAPIRVRFDPGGTSVRELVELALRRNAGLLATQQRALEARGLLRQAGLRPNPSVEASASSGPIVGSRGEHEVAVGYAHTFELGGKVGRRVDAAQRAADLAELEVADRQRELAAEVKTRYVDALTAWRNLDTVSRLLALSEEAFRLIQARVVQGEAPRLEQGLLRVELARLASDRLLFESQVDRASLELKTLAGLSLDDPLTLAPEWDLPPITTAVDEAVERAVAARPDLLAARREEELREAELRLARAEAVPDVVAFARYVRTRSQVDLLGLTAAGMRVPIRDRDNLLSAGVSVELPVRARNQGNIQAATARLHAARLRREYLEQAVRREVRSAYGRYEAARRALQILDQEGLSQARENVRVIRATYELGETRLLDLITEQRRLVDIERAYSEIARECSLAQIELERAVGAPLR